MNLQSFLNSRRAGKLALLISGMLPPSMGHRLARYLADWISKHDQLPLNQALRSNRWVISQGGVTANQLEEAARQNLRNIAHSFYTLFHYLNDPVTLQNLVAFTPQIEDLIVRSQKSEAGVIVAGLHLSNFDLVFQAAALHGLRAIGLSLPEANEAIQWQHEFRQLAGLEILPASVANFRHVINRLEAGETVVTGIDRPIGTAKTRPLFFGRPAHVPVHYIHLALKARVPLIIMGAILHPDGVYHIQSSDYIELQHFSDRETEILWNAEMILEIAADIIRQTPEQWAVMQPVWPEALADIPKEVYHA